MITMRVNDYTFVIEELGTDGHWRPLPDNEDGRKIERALRTGSGDPWLRMYRGGVAQLAEHPPFKIGITAEELRKLTVRQRSFRFGRV